MSNYETLPQDWGEHLKSDAPINAQHFITPKTSSTLFFEDMYPEPFEQMCWWLLQKDHTLTGCQRLGNKGKISQHGIDIFAFDSVHEDRLLVFECKCWRNFNGAALTEAVDRFLNNEWAESAERFTLILAQQSIKSLDRYWITARQKLFERGIEADLWTAEHLTEKLKNAPDVLTRFFSGPDVQQYCNHWMQKVGFHEALLKAVTDPRSNVSELANDFLANEIVDKDELTTRYINGRHWSLSQQCIDITALLPSPEEYPGSAIVSIKRPDTEGVIVALNQSWLLNHFLGNNGEPMLAKIRPFFQGLVGQQKNNHIIDFKNCRFFLSEYETKEIANVADELSRAYLKSLRQIEAQWEAKNFPFVNWLGTRVALCKVKGWVWSLMTEFANFHDTNNGTSEWHMFHSAPDRLMPVSASGYYGVLSSATIAGLCRDDQVAILWEPPTFECKPFVDAGWSCSSVYKWLVNELLPAVGRWQALQVSRYWRNWLHPFVTRKHMIRATQFWSSEEAYIDVRHVSLMDAEYFRELGVLVTLQTLQCFYNSTRSGRTWFTPAQLVGLYQAMLLLLEGERGYVGYMSSNLGVRTPCDNHEDLRGALRDMIRNIHTTSVNQSIDYVIRAMLEATGDEDGWIRGAAQERIFQALVPYMVFYDRQSLIDRHSLYL